MNDTGVKLLHNPQRNKGTAFTEEERKKYKLDGLLPFAVETLDLQLTRVNEQIDQFSKDINRYIYLLQLLDNNETLFFKTIMDNPLKYMPIIYTPTVGDACVQFGHLFRRPRGMYITIKDRGNIENILRNWREPDVRVTVVTDGERILGLGDLGISGMGIPIGKLCLYTACAGVPPKHTLPIVLDTGTNNDTFLNDPLYPGLKIKRVRGKEYEEFIDEFVTALNAVFPDICIQWEDFAGVNAITLLDKYRNKICTFNDDIQGTAGVIVAGLVTSSKITEIPIEDQKFLFLGAGAASVGTANLILSVLAEKGIEKEKALQNIWLFDRKGLITKNRTGLEFYKVPFARDFEDCSNFEEAVKLIKPTAIIGLSTIYGAFNKNVIELMGQLNERPVIMPCSNPTSHSECTAEEAYGYTNGRAVFASGSPFKPVTINNKTFYPTQGNNVYIFPALGLAVYAAKAKIITDGMFIKALYSLSEQVTKEDLEKGLVYPPMQNIHKVSLKVAIDVAEYIFDNGLASIAKPENVESFVMDKVYKPEYC